MFDKYFSLVYDFVKNKKWLVLAIVILLTSVAGIGLRFHNFSSSIELMLPDNEDIHRSINFLRDSNLSGNVVISLSLTSPDKDKQDLFRAVDQLTATLPPSLFSRVTTGFSSQDVINEIFFANYTPQIITEKELTFIDSQINPDSVSERLQEIYRQLLRPEGMFMGSIISADPLGIKLLVLGKLKAMSASMGYDVNLEDGYLISRDERHVMIITRTPVLVTDTSGSKKLMESLEKRLNQLPEYISANVISGHLHTLSNEKVIKRDIHLTIIIASVAFLLLFLIVFRDARAVLVFLIPLASVILSINLSNLFIGPLSYWVLGLGTVIAGISVDYGIHIYVAVRNSGNASKVIKLTAKPVTIGALTTMGIFFAFFFSNIQGYHQLALFSILSIIFALIYTLFVLPHFLSGKKFPSGFRSEPGGKTGSPLLRAKLSVVLWIFSIAAALILSFYVKLDTDVVRLDGSEPEIFQAEKDFRQAWGGQNDQAIFVVTGRNYEEAVKTNDMIYQELAQAVGAERLSSLAVMWPSKETREKNAARWNQFWRQGREVELKKLLESQGSKYQFSETAFSPFFDDLYAGTNVDSEPLNNKLSVLKDRFVQEIPEGYRVLSFFPDEKKYVDALSAVSRSYPGTFLVSRKALAQSISHSISSQVKLFVMIAATFIVLLTFLFLRNFKDVLTALVPVITGVLWLLGFMSLAGLTLNTANLISSLVVMGLCVDYGIFMTYKCRHNIKTGIVTAVSLSAVTTLIGAGVLLFARHPALFSIGITLVIGVFAGYISSIFVVPALQRLSSGETT